MTMQSRRFALLLLTSLTLRTFATAAEPAKPQWIWHPNDGAAATNGEVRFFRKTFTVEGKVQKAVLAVAAANTADVFLNEKLAVNARSYDRAAYTDVTSQIRSGENLLAIRGENDTAIRLTIVYLGRRRIGSDVRR